MFNSIFRTKKIEKILADAAAHEEGHSTGLKRVLTLKDLTFFGIAAILGAGSFSSLGGAVFSGGPGVVILFIITAIACAFTAFCYSEFASRIPVAGSAYTYAYASFGELFAWIIGWALIMEYSIGNIYVSYSWSDYFTSFLDRFGQMIHINLHLPEYLSTSYMEAKHAVAEGSLNKSLIIAWNNAPTIGGLKIILDLPALIINFLITYLVFRGIKESRNFSNIMVILKLAVVLKLPYDYVHIIDGDTYLEENAINSINKIYYSRKKINYCYWNFNLKFGLSIIQKNFIVNHMNFHKETLIAMFEEVFISWENILFNIDTDSWLSEYYSYANYVLASKNDVILEKIKVFRRGDLLSKICLTTLGKQYHLIAFEPQHHTNFFKRKLVRILFFFKFNLG